MLQRGRDFVWRLENDRARRFPACDAANDMDTVQITSPQQLTCLRQLTSPVAIQANTY